MNRILFFLWILTLAEVSTRAGEPTSQLPATAVMTNQNVSPVSCSIVCTSILKEVWVNAAFSNTTDRVVGVFDRCFFKDKYSTGNQLTWKAFEVTRNGQEVPYTGMLLRRLPPGPDEFYQMKPHEVVTVKIEIGRWYDFSKSGDYLVKYVGLNHSGTGSGGLFEIESSPVKVSRK